jgi:NifU-like protein
MEQGKYGNKVEMLINSPKNCGEITPDEVKELKATLFIHEYGSEEIGERITLQWAVDPSDDAIILARFTQFGSPAGIAANDMAALLCRNKTVDKAAEITYKGLEYFLRDNPSTAALPKEESYAITLALDAIREASKSYYNETATSTPSPCNDTPMSVEAIKETIKLHDLQTIEEITHYTKAGLYDTACVEANPLHESRSTYLTDILAEVQKELEAEKLAKMAPLDTPFREMDVPQKITAINAVIDESIRQFLIMDGGDMEILDVKENGAQIDIYIRYLGACNGCASSSTGTLFAIESTLKEKLDDQIRVLPI